MILRRSCFLVCWVAGGFHSSKNFFSRHSSYISLNFHFISAERMSGMPRSNIFY